MCFRTVFALLATISYPSEIGSKFALITFCLFLALTCFMNYANGKHRSSSYSHVFLIISPFLFPSLSSFSRKTLPEMIYKSDRFGVK